MADPARLYVLVPKENLTQGRWAEALELLRCIPDSEVPEYVPRDPESPVHLGEERSWTVWVGGLEFFFMMKYIEDKIWPDEHWPVPKGTSLIEADVWDKWGPSVQYEEVYVSVAKALMKAVGGIFANFANEDLYGEAETFKDFMRCHYGHLFLSRGLVDDVGRERLEEVGTLVDFDGGVEYIIPQIERIHKWHRPIDVLASAKMLECEHMRTPIPEINVRSIGLVLEPRFSSKAHVIEPIRQAKRDVDALPKMENEVGWAHGCVDEYIKTGDRTVLQPLFNRYYLYKKAKDHLGMTRVLPEVIRAERFHYSDLKVPYPGIELYDLGMAHMTLGENEAAEKTFMEYINLITERGYDLATRGRYMHALALRGIGQLMDASLELEEAIQGINPTESVWEWQTPEMLYDLAVIYIDMGVLSMASKTLKRLWPFAALYQKVTPRHMVGFLDASALLARAQDDVNLAEDFARRAVNHAWSNKNADVNEVTEGLRVLGKILKAKGDLEGSHRALVEVEELIAAGTKEEYLKKRGNPSGMNDSRQDG